MVESTAHTDHAERDLCQLEAYVQSRLNGRVRDFRLETRDGGLVLRGIARTYHAKQIAQHEVMKTAALPIRANEIEVI